jgi:hypothetical protein
MRLAILLLVSFAALLNLQATNALVNLLEGNPRSAKLAVSSGFHSVSDVDVVDITLSSQRRAAIALVAGAISGLPLAAMAEESMYAPGFVQEYADFRKTNEVRGSDQLGFSVPLDV